jgi:hypothetical protein
LAVNTIAMPYLSAAAMTSSSFFKPLSAGVAGYTGENGLLRYQKAI